jgi:3-hydroxybutyrate dehydrogenase
VSSAVSSERRVALVTGAAGGLGRAVCAALASDGLEVVGVDLRDEEVLHADVGTEAGNRRAVEAALERYGRLDVLVLNAAVQDVAPIYEFPIEQWDRHMDVMLKGPFLAIRAAWSALISRPGGRIVATASTSSFLAEPFKVAYIAAKHGLLGLVKVAAIEGAPHGLTANAVAPGLMVTGLIEDQIAERMRITGQSREEIIACWCAGQVVKRPVETAEVAAVVAFLAGEASSGITGACVPVELGRLALET